MHIYTGSMPAQINITNFDTKYVQRKLYGKVEERERGEREREGEREMSIARSNLKTILQKTMLSFYLHYDSLYEHTLTSKEHKLHSIIHFILAKVTGTNISAV